MRTEDSIFQIVDIVDTITKHNTETNENEPFVGHLNTDFYVLTDLLSKTLCGQEKTSIFAYFSVNIEKLMAILLLIRYYFDRIEWMITI